MRQAKKAGAKVRKPIRGAPDSITNQRLNATRSKMEEATIGLSLQLAADRLPNTYAIMISAVSVQCVISKIFIYRWVYRR